MVYSTLLVFWDEKKSVDSKAMRPIQTTAGHQARTRLGRDAVVKLSLPSLGRVVWSFARDHDVVNVAFAQAGGADAHESRLVL